LGQDRSASFGEVLRDFRLAAGMSQETLAERARMSASGISVLERGARRAPHPETVKLLADGLALSPTERNVLEETAALTLEQLEDALPLLNEAVDSAQKHGYRWPVCFLLQSLGRASIMVRDPKAARGYFQSSLATLREIGDTSSAVACAANLAEAEFHAGDVQTALRLAEEALAQQRRHGRMYEHGMTNVTAYLIALDRYDEAIAHGRDVLRRVRMDQHSVAVAWTIQHLAAATVLQAASEPAPMEGLLNAAHALGFVDARSNALGAPREYTEQQEYDRVLPRLREVLGAEKLEREMSAGATLAEDQATEVAFAL
jgi:transcriptional regulator with XRE-family HTH domain